jgi:hypothetical protein
MNATRVFSLHVTSLILLAHTAISQGNDDLLISEYGEGSGTGNKWVEIFNGTGGPVDLAAYQVWIVNNGGAWPEHRIALSGTLDDGAVCVVYDNDADAGVQGTGDINIPSALMGSYVSGNDAVGLAETNAAGGGWTLLDAVGRDGTNPPSTGWPVAGVNNATADHTLVRKISVTVGLTNWTVSAGADAAASQWIVYPIDTFTFAGYHGDAPERPPFLSIDLPVTSLFVTVGSTLAFEVTATDVNADTVTVTASGMPPGAVFSPNPLVGTAPLANTFTWKPSTAGVHSLLFSATDNDGADSAAITIEAVAPHTGDIWINEIHYGDKSAGTNEMYEGVELAGKSGTALTGYSLLLYNGSNRELYQGPRELSGTVDDEGGGYGAVWFGYPPCTIQNGPADGILLTETEGGGTNVLQFLSYEGTLIAADGPAAGWLSTDIGVEQSETTFTNLSLQLVGRGVCPTNFVWSGPVLETKGRLNSGQTVLKQGTCLVVK